ncbi:MAG TPA: hypothetical protein VLE27_12040 [Thermoanaerobaculia bacterium]|nr:hypothetical protein [Thermoanaerobaculia bacterium]
MSFNRAVEEAQNEMLLLNVVRSSLRRPMYITGIQTASGSIEVGASAGIAFPFGEFRSVKDEPDADAGTTGVTYTQNPSFDVTVFNTKEFVTGFSTPIDQKLMAYYWDQGWRPALLLHLLVEHIRITWPDGTQTVFDNYPDAEDEKACNHVRFAILVEHLVANNLSLQRVEEVTSVGPAFSAYALGGQLETLVTAHKEKLGIAPVPDGYQFQTTSQKVNVVLERREEALTRAKAILDKVCPGESGGLPPSGEPSMTTLKAPQAEDQSSPNASTEPASGSPELTGGEKGAVELFLRSPEAILYYLGELVRVENRAVNPRVPMACLRGHFEPIFLVRTTGCTKRSIAAAYDGDRYFIPERETSNKPEPTCGDKAAVTNPEHYLAPLSCNGGRSTSALILVDQLIALQKSASDLPAPRLLRTVGN